MKIELKKINGKGSGKKINIPDTIFSIKPNDHAIYLDVKQYLASKRKGTHSTKERGDIVGSRRKLRKQKGLSLLYLLAPIKVRLQLLQLHLCP